ncbi:hypothetical protein [Inquilinus limosus]|uniref:DUF7831 domain-containing protein n=1 Tax=Inquilinus limosus TaxID=171674 RepID=A0A211ZIN2_9PROT|nr:hypothetical protein [Inquilinus limosus]OWJ65119.1 hypothetical protein BWR60_21245 [Inquilinus limosus]
MPVEYVARYSREEIRSHPQALYVFGDNFVERGLGGQAAAARGEPNAVGIATKRAPSLVTNAFLTDADLARLQQHATPALDRLREHLAAGGTVVMPADGIGTGLAQMPDRAPACWRWLCDQLARLGIENPKGAL